MNVRKNKKKCMVRGCKSTDTYAVSQNREWGNSVCICRECLENALEAIENYIPLEKSVVNHTPPPLFYHGNVKQASDIIEQDDADNREDLTDKPLSNELKTNVNVVHCVACGKEFKTAAALKRHMKTHEESDVN